MCQRRLQCATRSRLIPKAVTFITMLGCRLRRFGAILGEGSCRKIFASVRMLVSGDEGRTGGICCNAAPPITASRWQLLCCLRWSAQRVFGEPSGRRWIYLLRDIIFPLGKTCRLASAQVVMMPLGLLVITKAVLVAGSGGKASKLIRPLGRRVQPPAEHARMSAPLVAATFDRSRTWVFRGFASTITT